MSCVQWFESIEKNRCGYCKQKNTSISNGMWAHSLTVEDYQNLIDRGWRRSGMYCYKPVMKETCCPQYTIKCDVTNFSLSKSQKKVIKKLNKYLETDILINKDTSTAEEDGGQEIFIRDRPDTDMKNVDLNCIIVDNKEDSRSAESTSEKAPQHNQNILDREDSTPDESESKTNNKQGAGADSSKPPCKKAKLLRLERKKEKLSKKGLVLEKKMVSERKSVEQFLDEMPSDAKNRLKIRLVSTSVPNEEWNKDEQVEFGLYRRYQMIVHNDPPEKLTLTSFQRFLVKSPLKIKLEMMSNSSENFEVTAELFSKYQKSVHGDSPEECDETQFFNFLVETPLKPQKFPGNAAGPGFGSFHQQYWLNDQLIAVGVLDILPRCVSSVYFFYDPDYRSLTLGTYGSLREVQLSRSLHENLPGLTSYYMGFYIHSCPKMRYKGKLSPSFLSCPETYEWIPIERCLSILDGSKYARLNADGDASDVNLPDRRDVSSMKIVYNRKFMLFRDYRRMCRDPGDYGAIANLVGKLCCWSLVFWEN